MAEQDDPGPTNLGADDPGPDAVGEDPGPTNTPGTEDPGPTNEVLEPEPDAAHEEPVDVTDDPGEDLRSEEDPDG